jgi:hypothetical protein
MNGKSRAEQPPTYEPSRSTTKLGGMWELLVVENLIEKPFVLPIVDD